MPCYCALDELRTLYDLDARSQDLLIFPVVVVWPANLHYATQSFPQSPRPIENRTKENSFKFINKSHSNEGILGRCVAEWSTEDPMILLGAGSNPTVDLKICSDRIYYDPGLLTSPTARWFTRWFTPAFSTSRRS